VLQIEDVPHKHRSDGVNGFMTVEPLVHKPFEGSCHCVTSAEGRLIFHNGMSGRV
jgi:hypothetical protein